MALGLLICWLFAASWVTSAAPFEQQCLSFQPTLLVPNSQLNVLQYVPAGTNLTFPGNDLSCARPSQVVTADLCRVALSIKTSNRSSIIFEQWLPQSWTGRFLATGNGVLDGCVHYEDVEYGSRNGFSTVGANNGHNGTGGQAFLNNEDVVLDYAHRSLHTSVLTGKLLTAAFYSQNYTKSYFIGCSLGGRQGIDSAHRYPTDFDGIVAGSPAVDFNNLYSWRATFYPITGPPTAAMFIPSQFWKTLIHNEVLRQCDTLDGVADEIIIDASLCNFQPESLLCTDGSTNSSSCLTAAQVSAVERIFSPFYGNNDTLIYPAMQPGSEILAADGLYSGKPWPYSQDWFRYAIYNNPNWDPLSFSVADAEYAEALNPGDIKTYPNELTAFKGRGGKLITYHGGQDNQISSFDTPRWVNYLSVGMDELPGGELDDWLRFFRVPGMFHCANGPGAWVYGQAGAASAAGIEFEPEGNVLAAAVAWVENGQPPDIIVGTKFINDTVVSGVAFRRRHCRYPLRSIYVGGDQTSEDSWACQEV